MKSNISGSIEYAKYLHKMGYLPGPYQCSCGTKNFVIYADSNCKTTNCSFRCINSKCRLKFPIRINSFFEKYNHKSLTQISEIIKCFIVRELNAEKTKEFLKNEYNITIALPTLYLIFKDIREIIYEY